jgi:hypothetical protein
VPASDKDGEHYIQCGCSQLLPSDLHRLRTYLLACTCLVALQLLVIIFIAVKLFLQSDEFANIKFEHILEASMILKENGVEGVVLKVKSNYHDAPCYLTLWADDECPELWLCCATFVGVFICYGNQWWLSIPRLCQVEQHARGQHLSYTQLSMKS